MLVVGTHLEALGELISKKGKDITTYQQKKRTHTYIQIHNSRCATKVEKETTLLLLMENNTGGWVNGCEIANECEKRKKIMHVSRTAAAEQCCFSGDGKCVFRFILKGSVNLYDCKKWMSISMKGCVPIFDPLPVS